MDNITEILTSIFVSKKKEPKSKKELSEVKQKAPSEKVPSEKVQSEKVPSEKVPSEKTQSKKESNLTEIKVESKSSTLSSSTSSTSSSSTSSSSSDSSSDSRCDSRCDSSCDSRSEKSVGGGNDGDFRKFVLKASEFYKNNILIINNDSGKNIDVLSEILYKLSKMTSVYDNSLHILTFNDNKKDFKEMLIENPYIHFTNLVFKNKVSEIKLKSDKRHIVIVDSNFISDINTISKLTNGGGNIQIIVLDNTYNNFVLDIYKILGDSALLINKKDRIKLLQKRFYSKVIKKILKEGISFDKYINIINDENYDVKNIIIKNNKIKYN